MTGNKNIIRKAAVNIQINGNADGMLLQQEVAAWCNSVLNPSIDSVLAGYEQSEEVILIDKISLDINLGSTTAWKEGLEEKILHQFREKVREKISSSGIDIRVRSLTGKFYDTLIYYLKHGILPWNTGIKNKNDLESELSGWIRTVPVQDIKDLAENIRDGRSSERFVNLLNQQDFELFIAGVFNKDSSNIIAVYELVENISSFITVETIPQQRLLNNFRKIIITELVANYSKDTINNALQNWLNYTAANYPGQIQSINPDNIKNPMVKNIIRQIQKVNQQELIGKAEKKPIDTKQKINPRETTHKPVKKTGRQKQTGEIKDASVKGMGNPEQPLNDKYVKQGTGNNDKLLQQELSEGVFINNAGAVIIAPFLHSLFSLTGLIDEEKITDAATALCLLHYCITGNTDPAEFELLLLKILCGIDPETIVDITPVMDEKVLREADEMLNAIIEHWNIIKNTSIEGLRETFLLRSGKLSFVKEEWLLQVETRVFDMLLEQLPWNIKMIKLPWMKNILITQWIS